jgi:hypothetical protein
LFQPLYLQPLHLQPLHLQPLHLQPLHLSLFTFSLFTFSLFTFSLFTFSLSTFSLYTISLFAFGRSPATPVASPLDNAKFAEILAEFPSVQQPVIGTATPSAWSGTPHRDEGAARDGEVPAVGPIAAGSG